MTGTPDLMAAMRKRYAQPQWALLEEVRDGAGHSARRSADAVAMSLWPSRGLEIHGFEVKASRSDWTRELKNPAKAESIARFCDRWWLVASSAEIVRDGELPPAWGLLVYDRGLLRTVREAEKTEAQPVSRSFLAALLRRADPSAGGWVRSADVEALVEAKLAPRVEAAERLATMEARRATEKADLIAALEEAIGEPLREWITPNLKEALSVVRGRARSAGWVAALEREAVQARQVANVLEELAVQTRRVVS